MADSPVSPPSPEPVRTAAELEARLDAIIAAAKRQGRREAWITFGPMLVFYVLVIWDVFDRAHQLLPWRAGVGAIALAWCVFRLTRKTELDRHLARMGGRGL